MSLAMTRTEREAFLADVHIGVFCVDEPGRGPTALPIWYLYEPGGDVRISMGADSLKARLARAAGRATMLVQTETAPYKYVAVEGPVTIEPREIGILEMATRYLGAEGGARYARGATGEGSVTVRLRPEHWRTIDYYKR